MVWTAEVVPASLSVWYYWAPRSASWDTSTHLLAVRGHLHSSPSMGHISGYAFVPSFSPQSTASSHPPYRPGAGRLLLATCSARPWNGPPAQGLPNVLPPPVGQLNEPIKHTNRGQSTCSENHRRQSITGPRGCNPRSGLMRSTWRRLKTQSSRTSCNATGMAPSDTSGGISRRWPMHPYSSTSQGSTASDPQSTSCARGCWVRRGVEHPCQRRSTRWPMSRKSSGESCVQSGSRRILGRSPLRPSGKTSSLKSGSATNDAQRWRYREPSRRSGSASTDGASLVSVHMCGCDLLTQEQRSPRWRSTLSSSSRPSASPTSGCPRMTRL